MSSSLIAGKLTATLTHASMSVALRNLCLTFALTITAFVIVGRIRADTGYEMLIVTMGWPHVIIGFLFYFGKVWRGESHARSSFLLLSLATLLIWVVHYFHPITWLIYIYFLYHALRDEIFVYLQTRARHTLSRKVFDVAGVAPLILLLLIIPQPQDFRRDVRRVELTTEQLSANGWTLIRFKPIPYSRGRDFYFSVQAPHTEALRLFTTEATLTDARPDGEIRISDALWTGAADLVFKPHYYYNTAHHGGGPDGEMVAAPVASSILPAPSAPTFSPASITPSDTLPVLMTGGHRVGQTFTAERDYLAGIWLPTHRLDAAASDAVSAHFVFRLASPPLLPLSSTWREVRLWLIALLTLVVVWKMLPHLRQHQEILIYLTVFVACFIVLQKTLKTSIRAGYIVPMLFQFVVVFHYFSWYVFSFDKLQATTDKLRATTSSSATAGAASFISPPQLALPNNCYDRLLARLRRVPDFTVFVVGMNLVSAAGVLWFYQQTGPTKLAYAFDYNIFLYILVLHVTFSFNPQRTRIKTQQAKAST